MTTPSQSWRTVARRAASDHETPEQGIDALPTTTTKHDEWTEALDRALAVLPQAHAEALRLNYFDRLSQREIARRLGRSDTEIAHLIAQAMHALATLLERDVPTAAHGHP